MPTLTALKTKIKEKLEGVTGIGNVYDYERYANKTSEFKTLYVNSGKINGWHFRRTKRKDTQPYIGRREIVQEWTIRGFISLDDAGETEKTFDALIDNIIDAFFADDTLGGIIDTMIVNNNIGIQLLNSQPVMFAGVLCHSAELQFSTRHFG